MDQIHYYHWVIFTTCLITKEQTRQNNWPISSLKVLILWGLESYTLGSRGRLLSSQLAKAISKTNKIQLCIVKEDRDGSIRKMQNLVGAPDSELQ